MAQGSEAIPLNLITKIIVETVKEDTNVQEDFLKALSRAASLFILYCTTRANEIASENNRRSVYSQDVLSAISNLGFEHLVPELAKWHSMYVEEKEKSSSQKTKKKKNDESELDPSNENQ